MSRNQIFPIESQKETFQGKILFPNVHWQWQPAKKQMQARSLTRAYFILAKPYEWVIFSFVQMKVVNKKYAL